MEGTLCLSKPLFISHAHKPAKIINLHHNAANFHLPSSLPCSNFKTRPHQLFHHQTVRVDVGGYLSMQAGPMCLSGALKTCSEIVGMKNPVTGRKKMLLGKRRRVPSWRSLTLEGLRRGSLPPKVLLEAKEARLKPQLLDDALSEFEKLLSQLRQLQHLVEFYKLEEVCRKLEMSRKEDLAVESLKRFLSSVNVQKIGDHESYVVKLLLAEMLIYQGQYEEARDICTKLEQEHKKAMESTPPPDSSFIESIFQPFPPDSLVPVQHIGPTDYRLKLYQAVTNAMLEEMVAANKYWDEFAEMTLRGFGVGGPPKITMGDDHGEVDEEEDLPRVFQQLEESGPSEMPRGDAEETEDYHKLTFQQFLDHMEVLKQEIQVARK